METLDLFFKQNYLKKFREADKNIFEDKIDRVIYVLRLLRDEKQKIIQGTDNDKKENLVTINFNIEFLTKYANALKQKNKQTKKNKDKKRVYRKKENQYLEELGPLITRFENNYDYDALEYNEIINLIKYYYNKKISLITEKNNHLDDELEQINRVFQKLVNEKNRRNKNNVKQAQPIQRLLPIGANQLKSLDEYFGVETLNIVEGINSKEIELFLGFQTLYDIYIKCKKENLKTKINLITNRKKLKRQHNNEELIKEIDEMICNTNIHMDILNNLINYLKYYQKSNSKNNKENALIFTDEVEITDIQQIIEDNLKNGLDIESYELEDILYAIGHYIKYEGVIDIDLLKITKEVFNKYSTITVKDDSELSSIYYIWDSIKYRLSHTPKEDEKTREILKCIRIEFDYIIENYKEDKEKFVHDYRFDIVDYFLKNEEGYLYLKNLVQEIPDIVNTRHIVKENDKKNSEHIIIHILKEYIYNYKKMLRDSKTSYINKDYLKSIYLLFMRNYRIYLTSEEKYQIDRILSNFMKEVNIVLTSSRRKSAVKEDLKDMYTHAKAHTMYSYEKNSLLNVISDHKLESEMNNIYMRINNSINRQKRVDLTHECTFLVGSGYEAYSVEELEDKIILKIHVIDLYDIFVRNSELERYLYNITLTKEEIDDFILGKLDMNITNTYPTITYEIEFDKKGNYKRDNGHIKKFSMYQSKIHPKVYYNESSLLYKKGDIVLKSFLDLYRISLIKNHGNYESEYSLQTVKDYFESILNQGITEYFKFNKLPFIYSGIKEKDEQESIRIMNNISHILSRISEDDFRKIYKLIDSNVDEFHYSIKEFNGEYSLSIQNPLNTVGLLIQRILHEIVFENKHTEEEYLVALRDFENQIKELIMYINCYNSYMDADILKQNKGKIKKREKILF